jgi:DNA-directed RNA polymerase specialized sigma subunit
MRIFSKARKYLSSKLGQDLTDDEINEANKILERPKIQEIRKWNSSMPSPVNQMVQSGTKKVVTDYVKNKRKNKSQ